MVSGTETADFEFWDEDRQRMVTIHMQIQEGIKLKLLQKIEAALRTK